MNSLKEIAAYCAANIDCWEAKCEIALYNIGMHIPIDWDFGDEIEQCVEEWCEENKVSLDFFEDWEDIAEEIIMC